MSKRASPKTICELVALREAWIRTFERGANGNQECYNLARDTRYKFEEEKWILVKGWVAEVIRILEKEILPKHIFSLLYGKHIPKRISMVEVGMVGVPIIEIVNELKEKLKLLGEKEK